MREFLYFLRNVLLNTWMIALYYVIDETEVTQKADINRKELALELSVFCFQWVLTFWLLVLIVAFYGRTRRNRSGLVTVAYSITFLVMIVAFGYLYYRNL